MLTCNGVYIPYATIRVGGVNEEIVGQGTNGWTSEINSDNTIGNWQIACIHPETGDIPIDYKWVECPFGNKTSERFVIPSMDKVRDVVNKLHPLLPHFRWIGWDFTIDSEDEPVLIEMNLLPGHVNTQFTTCTPMFGDKTQNILDDYYIYRTLEGNHRQDRLFD